MSESLRDLEAQLLLLESLREGDEERRDGEPEVELTARGTAPAADGLPLSFAQERLWFIDRLEPGGAAYNVPLALRLTGELSVPALSAVLDEVARRHEVLRSRFRAVDGEPRVEVAPPAPLPLPRVDLSVLPPARREATLTALARAAAARPFDLAAGPLLRATLLRLGGAEHAVFLTVHHIAFDGWSAGVLVREVAALYRAFRDGAPSPLPPLAVQYADYAAWQRRRLAGGRLQRELEHWRQRLDGLPPSLDLPTDRPRGARRSFRGERVAFTLPPPVSAALTAVARDQGATPFMVLLALYAHLLGDASGQDDLAVGTPVAGRPRAELEGLLGFFINTLVLRVDLAGRPTFLDLVARVRDVALDAFAHQEVPFERLVEELAPQRSLSHTPLFQVMFGFDNAPEAEASLGDLKLAPVRSGADSNKFDLNLAMVEVGGRFGGTLSFARDLFDRASAEALVRRFERLAAAVAAAPRRRLDEHDLLSPEERRQIVAEWGRRATLPPAPAPAPAPAPGLVRGRIEAAAAAAPDAVAVVYEDRFGEQRLTYGELDRRAARLAQRLGELGAGPGEAVALWLGRSPDFLVALLATWKAGAFYVPLDDTLPAARAAALLAAVAPRVLLDDGDRGAELPPGTVAARLRLDRPADWLPAAGEARPPSPPTPLLPQSLAYVLFTSGSTGEPKAVGVEHRQVEAYLQGILQHLGAGAARRRLALVSTFAADLGHTVLLPALASGGELHVLSRQRQADPPQAAAYLRRQGIEGMKIVPSHLAALLADDDDALPSAWLVLGGESLDASLLSAVHRRRPSLAVHNHYGPTETTVGVAAALLAPPADGAATLPPPLGRPLGANRLYVVDRRLRLRPAGLPGELLVGGPQVSRGYLGRPAATAERFVPDPFAAAGDGEGGGRLYRTGDRVRWRGGGELEFLGRVDQQLKVRGFRVEPGEVEAALVALPGVRDAVVVARGEGAGRTLVGYWVADRGVTDRGVAEAGVAEVAAGAAEGELRDALRRTLPEHMVPSRLLELDAIPLTANGKVDRRALPEPASETAGGEAPEGWVEEVVAAVWQEVLGIAELGRRADFFALGGHSLLATRVASRVRRAVGAEVELRALFEAPTLAAYAARVAAALRAEGGVAAPPVTAADRSRPLPLSFSQERLWFLDRLEPGLPTYNIPRSVRLGGALSAPALEAALGEVERRHEVLRTRYLEDGGEPRQVVDAAAPRRLPVVDLSHLGDGARHRELGRLAAAEALRPFDLAAGPVQRARLLRLAADDHAFLFTQHHVASDAWSAEILLHELSTLYRVFAAGAPSPLPELAVQYADYAAWQRGWLTGDVLAAQVEWWRGELDGLPPLLELPVDRPRTAQRSPRAGSATARLGADATAALRELARRRGASPFMVLLAAFQGLLHRLSGQADFAVGTPVAGREGLELEPLIGFFVNTLVLRAEVAAATSFADLVEAARERALSAHAHQGVPFEKLVEELAPERSLSHAPLFQVLFVYATEDPAAVAPEGAGSTLGDELTLRPLGEATPVAKFDLTLAATQSAGRTALSLEYARDLFDAATAEALARRFVTLLTAALEQPEQALAELPLLAVEERRQLLGEWSGAETAAWAAADGGDGASLWHLFAAQAAATPAAPALSWVEATADGGAGGGADVARTWSYGELAARSLGLAAHLSSLGAGPETRVGVLLERTPELVTALLGTLATGAAYVPLDPAYPASRLEVMLGDGGARLLVAEADLPADLALPAGLTVVRRGTDGDLPSAELPAGWASPAAPHHLAYVIFTSGSTGRPKGVAIEHRAATALVGWARRRYGADELAGVLAATSVCFDLSVYELFATLACGGTVVLADSALALPRVARQHRVTLVNTVPSAMAELVRSGAVPESVTTVNLAGEALPRELAEAIHGLGHVARLYNLYGPSEDTTYSTEALIGDDGGKPAIGRPLPGGRAYVVDAAGRPVPPGVAGELLLGGAGLARGYLGRPALSAERWVPDGLSGDAGARLYRTGDRARWLADGALDYLGRVDQQVKVRGFRVEPGEIEALLVSHPAVRECAVVARPGADGHLRLDAFWAAENGADGAAEATAADLVAWLADRLPAHMVPAALVELDVLPLTPNGKVDRKALAALPVETVSEAPRVAPRDAAEEVVAEIWCQVLGVDEVGVEDHFFRIGGHSLLATRVLSRLHDAFQVELPLRRLFEEPTVAAIVGALGEIYGDAETVREVARTYQQVAGLSAEEIEALLSEDS